MYLNNKVRYDVLFTHAWQQSYITPSDIFIEQIRPNLQLTRIILNYNYTNISNVIIVIVFLHKISKLALIIVF